ncbi:MAG: hypothetical protein LBP62_05690 [Clostridiales bacterium]|jgi:hypothetical protein|nr:hypothetical protein [Clostridiales bacterium]
MTRNPCRNSTEWLCDRCKKRIARYATLGGYHTVANHYEIECGTPQCDQGDKRFYCADCIDKVKPNLMKDFKFLRESDFKFVKKEEKDR